MKLEAVDRWLIVYAAYTSGFALIFAGDQTAFAGSHIFHGVAILVSLAVARWMPSQGRFWPFLRHGYVVPIFGLFYRDTAHYIHLIFDRWFDPALIDFETAVFGTDPTTWIASINTPWLLDFWMTGYFAYYLLAPVAIAITIWQRKPELFRRMTVASAAAFFISYTMFYLFPLEGPRYAMAGRLPPLEGIIFFNLVMWVQNSGSIHGGCMPSSHTAVAWVVTYYALLAHRISGRILVAISAVLTVGCVWGRFHYLTDVVVGLIIFAGAVWATERYNAPEAAGRSDTAHRAARIVR